MPKREMCGVCENNVLLIQIECRACLHIFYLCRSCFRGHAYCSQQCRETARRDAHRITQSRYRTSGKGRKANKEATRRGRIEKSKNSVADRGSISPPDVGIVPPLSLQGMIVCLFCGVSGKVVVRFPRRGYRPTSFFGKKEVRPTPNTQNWRHHAYQKDIGPPANSPDP